MEQFESDQKLLTYWLARKADAQTALDTANRQIAYLSNFVTRGLVEPENEAGWIERGNE